MTSSNELEWLYAQGAASFPTLTLSFEAFREHVARAVTPGVDLTHLPAEDLFLAAACAMGVPRASEEFEARMAPLLEKMGALGARLGVDRDELLQTLRTRLFVPNAPRPSLIHSYAGRGPLGAWVRVVATRLAMELGELRHPHEREATTDQWERALGDMSVELSAMRTELRTPFQRALDEAANRITPIERALLKQYYAHGVGIDGLAKLLGIHRSNASRALAKARAALLSETKRSLGRQLELFGNELDSVFRLMRSDVNISLREVFRSISAPQK